MIGGIFILGKRFMVIEYVGVLLVAAGMVVFSSGDVNAAKAGTEFSSLIIGVVLNIGSLAMNSFQDNYQEKGLHAMRLSENDMVRHLSRTLTPLASHTLSLDMPRFASLTHTVRSCSFLCCSSTGSSSRRFGFSLSTPTSFS